MHTNTTLRQLSRVQYVAHVVCVISNSDLGDIVIIVLTDVDCGSLTNPANGRVDHTPGTTPGQAAIYICNTGYSCVSSRDRTKTQSVTKQLQGYLLPNSSW